MDIYAADIRPDWQTAACPSFLETGPVARAPDMTFSARRTGLSSGRALVPYARASTPAIDHASAARCTMATRAASVCGIGRAED
jgi:hypothetical protein